MNTYAFSSARFANSFPSCKDGALTEKYYQLLTQLFPEHGVFVLLLNPTGELFIDTSPHAYRFTHPGILLHLLTNGPSILFTNNLKQKPYHGVFCKQTEDATRFFVCSALKSNDGRMLGAFGVIGEQARALLPDEKAFIGWLADNLSHDIQADVAPDYAISNELSQFPQAITPYLDDIYIMADHDGVIISMAEQVPAALRDNVAQRGGLLSSVFGKNTTGFFNDLINLADATHKKQTNILPIAGRYTELLYSVSCNRFSDGWYLFTFHDITERNRLRELLESRKQLLEGVVQANNVGILLLNDSGEVVYANEKATDWFSLEHSRDELKMPAAYWCRTDNSMAQQYPFQQIFLQQSDLKDVRYECLLTTGARKVFSLNAVYKPAVTNLHASATIFIQDITERALLDQALLEMEQQMQFLLQASPVVIYQMTHSPLGQIIYISPNSDTILAINEQEALNSASYWLSRIHPDDKTAVLELLTQTQEQALSLEYRFAAKGDSNYRWIKDIRRLVAFDINAGWIGALLDITDRKLAERAREQAQQQFELLAQHVPGVLYQYRLKPDGSSHFPYASPGIVNIYGVQPEQVRDDAQAAFNVLHPDDVAKVSESIVESAQTGKLWQCQYRVNLPAGKTIWVDGQSAPTSMSDGSTVWHGYIRDITAQKLAEHAAKAHSERAQRQRNLLSRLSCDETVIKGNLSKALQIVTKGLADSFDIDRVSVWMFSQANNTMQRTMLFERNSGFNNEACTLNYSDLPEYFNALLSAGQIDAEDVQRDPRTKELVSTYLKPLGIVSLLDTGFFQNGIMVGVLCAECFGNIRYWHSDETAFFSAIANLVSLIIAEDKRKKAELKRVAMQRQLASTLESLVDAVITIDKKGQIVDVNQATCTMFGYSKDTMLGHNVSMLMPSAISQHHDSYMDNYVKSGVAKIIGIGREVNALHADGHEFPITLSIAAVGEGKNQRFVGCCHDLSVIKKQQEQLLHSEKLSAVGKLTSSLAHDFNNILGIVRGYAEMLQQESEHVVQLATPIIDASDRASAMISQLLDFSSSKQRAVSKIQLNAHLKRLQPLLEQTLAANVTMNINLCQQDLFINIELPAFDNALINLVVNASHALQGLVNGCLHIGTALYNASALPKELNVISGDYASIAITDNGCGMSEQVRQKIFEPFFTTKGDAGTGLGLAQTYGMVQRCKGYIDVTSTLGKGTCFTLYFPLVPLAQNAVNSPVPDKIADTQHLPLSASGVKQLKTDSASKAVILLVDDEVELLEMNTLLLESAGYSVLAAQNAKQALGLSSKHHFDLLLSDIVMPEMNGFELAKALKATYPDLKVQLMSGYTDKSMITDDEYNLWYEQRLAKPVALSALLKRIAEVLTS
ncbi:PAS domain S-box protein [Rheinheimera baltica]|uniref:histidine kinase n=1 Tax=Rheinheimera baltica TaxID=67576 RepID=A0ABT9I3E6_9GAMM|nr:PAS domain S-box protein [Rheinheimera baltica]MDP5137906.1 PAS domain S-box protein [Rheinheimera baltica]